MTKAKVTTDDVVEMTGITYRRLDSWARLGYLQVPITSHGKFGGRDWPDKEILAAVLIDKMSKAGIQPIKACRVARLIVDNPDENKTKRSARIGAGVWLVVETEGVGP